MGLPRQIQHVAVLGLGSIGSRHARNLATLGKQVLGFDPMAPDRSRLPDTITLLASRKEAIRQADAVVIATPSEQHLEDLALCVELGKPALVEKPMAHDPDALAAILQTAADRDIPIGAVFNLRERNVVQKVQQLLATKLGATRWARFVCASHLANWRPGADFRQGYANDPQAGGVIFDVIHEIDLALHLVGPGETVAAVARSTPSLQMRTEDVAEIVLDHGHGVLSSLHLDYACPVPQRRLEICGIQGIVSADLRTGSLSWSDGKDESWHDITPIHGNAEYLTVLQGFLQDVETGTQPRCSGFDGLRAVKQAVAARRAAGIAAPEAPR